MKIERQCKRLVDALTEYVRNDLLDDCRAYCAEHAEHKQPDPPDSEINVDEHKNIVCIGGSLSGDRSRMESCIIGEGIDVEIGEGSLVVGCIFSRLELACITNPGVKELEERHKIVIGKNCVLIGALFRDDCTIGDNAVIADSAVSQTELGPDARLFFSSVLTRYSRIGQGFTAVQTIFHTDRAEIGAGAFMMSGKWGIISWGTAFKTLRNELHSNCAMIVYNNSTTYMLRDILLSGVDNYDKEIALQEEEENDPKLKEWMKRANPPVHRRQYLCLEQLAGKKFRLDNNILCFNHEGITVEDASMRPMCVVLRNLFREADPDMENEVYDAYRHTLRQFYSYEPRIHIGDNLRVYYSAILCVSRLKEDHPSYDWETRVKRPHGFSKFAWNKMSGREFDLWIGDDCLITTTGDWIKDRIPKSYDRMGYLCMKDGCTLYMPEDTDGATVMDSSLQRLDVADSRYNSSLMNTDCEYMFEEGSKVFLRGAINQSRDDSLSHVFRVKVRRNDMAVI